MGLQVISIEPTEEQFYDFSTLRIVFSEEVEQGSVRFGETFKFIRVSTGEGVNGTLIVRNNRLVFDPDNDLIAGEEYSIELTDGIKGLNSEGLNLLKIAVVPKNTEPRASTVFKMTPDLNDVNSEIEELPLSEIAGIYTNSIETNSKLLGRQYSFVSGILESETADLQTYSESIPTVMRKGQKIRATGMALKLGGVVDTLLNTGEITLTLLSDATGVISSNPFKNYNRDFPPSIYLNLDTCMTSEDPRVNSQLNQDTLNLRLFGSVTVEGDNMIINVVGTGEMDVLGVEKASVTLNQRLVSTNTNVELPKDTTPPGISSISPLNGDDNVPVSSSIIVVFTEPVKESTLAGRITLSDGSGEIAGNVNILTAEIRSPAPTDPDQRPILRMNLEFWLNVLTDNGDIALDDNIKIAQLEGRVDFLPDGRMAVQLQNTNVMNTYVYGGMFILRQDPGDLNTRAVAPVRY